MRKWQTITITALSTLTLSTAGFVTYNAMQPTYHAGQVFNNESSVSTSTSVSQSQSASSSSSVFSTESSSSTATTETVETPSTTTSSSEVLTQRGGTLSPEEFKQQVTFYKCGAADPAYLNVVHQPTGELICLPKVDAVPFCDWMNSIAHGKQTLEHSMQDNYDYWKQNVKGQQ